MDKTNHNRRSWWHTVETPLDVSSEEHNHVNYYVFFTNILFNLIRQGAFKMLERMNLKKERINDIHSAMNVGDMNDDGIVDFEEWRQQMKR